MPIMLVSGGLDSFISWKVLDEPPALFINYGQPYIEKEMVAVRSLYPTLQTVEIPNLPPLGNQIHIPARNLFFATIAVRFSNRIFLGGVKDELCSDKSPAAFRQMSSVLSRYSNYEVSVDSPLWKFTKAEAVRYYQANPLEKDFPIELLHQTVSCYSDGPAPCNNCESCFRRFVALAVNNIVEPDRLPHKEIITQFIRRIHTQPISRRSEMIRALRNAGFPVHVVILGTYCPIDGYTIVLSDDPEFRRTELMRQLPPTVGLLLGEVLPS